MFWSPNTTKNQIMEFKTAMMHYSVLKQIPCRFSLDNRRLYVFKEVAKKGVFTQIPVIDTPSTEVWGDTDRRQQLEIGEMFTRLKVWSARIHVLATDQLLIS